MKKPTIQTFLIQVQIRFFVDSWKKKVHHIHLCLLNVVPGINVLQRKKTNFMSLKELGMKPNTVKVQRKCKALLRANKE